MNEAEINRIIAKQAARGIYLYAHQQQGTSDLRARLLAEAKATDRFYCSDDEMVVMAVSYTHLDVYKRQGHC